MANDIAAAAEHHVHFDETTLKEDDYDSDDSCVTYQQVDNNVVDVHLGFLQHNHRYLIELHLPADLFKCTGSVPINLVADNNVVPNVHCKLADRVSEVIKQIEESNGASKESKPDNDSQQREQKFYVIKVEYFAHKEKVLREELKLVNANNLEELLKLVVSARVLGKGKGTPMLRNGIHCLGSEADIESEQSEHDTAKKSPTSSKHK